jgi:hypothetical protein
MPNPDPSGSFDTRPRHERLRSHWEIADRDFLLHNILTIENSDEQDSDDARSFATCPRKRTAQIDSRGFGTYDVLVLMASRTLIFRWANRRWFSLVATGLTDGQL